MSTSTALGRVLALPLMAGLLAGCDYASKLPDAPATIGYELQGPKPPSIVAEPALPPAPVQTVAAPPPVVLGSGLDTQTLQVSTTGLDTPREALALPPSVSLPVPRSAPSVQGVSVSTGGAPVFTAPPSAAYDAEVPTLGAAPILIPEPPVPAPQYTAVSVDAQAGKPPAAPKVVAPPAPPAPVAMVPAPPAPPPAFEAQSSTLLYGAAIDADPLPYGVTETAALDVPPLSVGTAPVTLPPVNVGSVDAVSAPPVPAPVAAPVASLPPSTAIQMLHTRLDNGAVVKVHPVVGAPGAASMALTRTIASELGAVVDASALARAPAVFDLRAVALPDRAEAKWDLYSSNGTMIGSFPETNAGGTWNTLSDAIITAMGRNVAKRLRRNADLRRATLTSVASAPPITSIDYSASLPGGAPSLAPMPRTRPVRATRVQPAPVQTTTLAPAPSVPAPTFATRSTAPVRSAPAPVVAPVKVAAAPDPAPRQQFVVNTQAAPSNAPLVGAIPRRRPEGTRVASIAPVTPGQQIQPVAPQPPASQFTAPAPTIAPVAPPAPSFDTLRASVDDGPRALVFRGVRGAPGNGDQALGREVSRLLGQSGAKLSPDGTPNALYLTADVSRTRKGGSDSIKILWHVEEADGTRVGQVVQENDVPAGSLDASWGEDAFYAAQGARDGIMELLRTSGAIGT